MKGTGETHNGCLPQGWEEASIGDITTLVYRYPTYCGITYVDEGVPEVRGELLLDNGEIESDRSKFRFIAKDTANKFPKVRLDPGDIVMSVRGTMGKIGIVREQLRGAVITANLIRLSPRREMILPDFFRLALLTPEFIQALNSASPQTTIKTITAPALKDLTLAVPRAISEQRKIAAILGLVQRAIEQQERLIVLTTELKKALLHKFFTEGLLGEPQKQTELGPVPESWELKTIGDLFKFSSGKSRPKDTEPVASISKPFPVYGGNGILGYSGSFLLEQPVLLLGRVGEYCGCAHHTEGRAWISDNALYAKDILGDIDTLYAEEFFAYANLNQYSNRAGQPLITQGIISEVKMPLPTLEEQRAILEPVTLLNRKLNLHETKRSVVTNFFRTLLHQLMTAQIRVHDVDLDEILPQPVAEISDGVAPRAGALVKEGQVVHN